MLSRAPAGFSLIECMIAVAIFSLLALMAMPSFSRAIQDAQVRTAAQSISSGLQLARAEAIRRNVRVRFRLQHSLGNAVQDGGTDWRIDADSGNAASIAYVDLVESRNGAESARNARIGIKDSLDFANRAPQLGAVADIFFTALGRIDTSPSFRRIDVFNDTDGKARRLSIVLGAGGQIRLCDPDVSLDTNPQGCA